MKTKTAFTLVELLVVISIIALLLSILMPVLSRSRKQAQTVVCLSQLKQMVLAAYIYAENNKNYYPLAYDRKVVDGIGKMDCWDFMDSDPVKPGILWQGQGFEKIQQCPSFKGASNMTAGRYSGYNYNSSYIGGFAITFISGNTIINQSGQPSVSVLRIRRPAACALFGDGQFSGGANKFMRSPFAGPVDEILGFGDSWTGAQGYRHLAKTNIGWADGSVSSLKKCFNPLKPVMARKVVVGTGFISPDNSAYGLD